MYIQVCTARYSQWSIYISNELDCFNSVEGNISVNVYSEKFITDIYKFLKFLILTHITI